MTTQTPPLTPPEKHSVFIINLEKTHPYEDLFATMYSDLLVSLAAKYHVLHARDLDSVHAFSNEQLPVAILFPDPAITLAENSRLQFVVKKYVESGGMAIFFGLFTSHLSLDIIDNFWKICWGLDWKHGGFHHVKLMLNWTASPLGMSSMPESYSPRALFLKNVAQNDMVYWMTPDSHRLSHIHPAGDDALEDLDPNETGVALAKVGAGWLGYIGDTQNEPGTQAVIHSFLEFACTASQNSQVTRHAVVRLEEGHERVASS